MDGHYVREAIGAISCMTIFYINVYQVDLASTIVSLPRTSKGGASKHKLESVENAYSSSRPNNIHSNNIHSTEVEIFFSSKIDLATR